MPGRLSEAEGGDEGFLAENGTSPDAAAQAAHDAGRLAESTVDAFWDAVRGDVSAVTQWKEREKARVDAETAHAARWGAERFRKDLAALADRDAQGRLAIGGGYLDDWSVRAQDAFNRGLRTEAQIAEGLGIPYGAWMTHHPLGGRGEDTITGVIGEDGRDIRASDLLDLSHEWHHVGRRFDEALFLDPNDFPDVRTPADIDDKQTAALFFYYTRMREAPREVNRASLTAEERDALTQRERPVWESFARTVAPARDAFVRAIAAEAEPDTLRPLAEAYANAMRAHKRLADDATKQFLASIGKPRAYLNERPHRAGSVRYSVVGTPVASTPITTKEATEILKAKEDVIFTNAAEHVSATIKNRQRNKLVSADARSKSRANGFSDTEHLNAATQAGELFETARLVEDRQGKLDNGSEDPNVRIQRYVAPVTIDRAVSPITATAYLTVKVSTSYRRPKNQSEQTPNRIYSLELLELRDPRLQGQGPASSDVQPNARESTDTVAYPGADVNPRLSVGGLYSGASVAYDRPSLRAVGSNHRGTAMGWGLYTDTRFVVASAYATGPAAAIHEQRWWTNRPEGDESHLLDWDKPLSPENHARVLSAIDALDLDPRDLEATFGKGWRTEERTGGQAYELVADVFRHLVDEDTLDAFGSDLQAASEHLAAFDIDGIVSHHSDASATYVAFSDEHLQVVRRWVWDPQTQDFALDTTFLPPTPAPRRSIGGWLDQATEAHLAAEREGDVETAQRLVYEASDRSEYRYKAAHGTGHFGFTVFDPNKSDDKRSLFFAGDPTLAATYQWQATDISGYGSANTAFRDVASTIRPLELDLNAEYPNDAAFIHAVTEAVERAGGTVSVGHLEPGSGGTVEVAPHEHITLKPWPQDYILVTMPRSDGPKAFDILTPDTMVRETKALNAAKEEELRGYAARLKAEYEADPNGEYFGAFERMSKKDRWLQAEHTLQTFLKNPQPYLEDDRLTAAQSAAMATIRMNWEFYRRNDSFGIYHVALRMDNPLVIDAQGGNWSAIDIKLPGSNRKHWKTRQLAEYAQTHGYDGVQINNVYDLGPNYIPGAGRKPSSVYIVFDGNQVKSLDPFTYDDSGNLIPLSERFDATQPDIRLSVGGSARYARADFVARATPIANDPSVKEADVRLFPIGNVPDTLVRYGATPGGLITFDGKVAKMARRHDLPPERLVDAIEAMNDPVAIFLEWEDAARGRIGLSVLTDVLADDGEGRQAPVRLTLISRTDAAGMLITSAYARTKKAEAYYQKVVANGGLIYLDEQRASQLPMEAETQCSLETSNVRGGPSTGTVPNREEEVKENVRRAIGGVERARRVGAAAALYYGRSPAVADVATAAIVELALLAEADRSGKRYSTQDIKDAYADFGIHADDLWSEAWRLARCGSAADRPRISG